MNTNTARLNTATSQSVNTTLGSPRHGMKQDIEEIYNKLQEHDDAIARIDQVVEKNAALADDNIKVCIPNMKIHVIYQDTVLLYICYLMIIVYYCTNGYLSIETLYSIVLVILEINDIY